MVDELAGLVVEECVVEQGEGLFLARQFGCEMDILGHVGCIRKTGDIAKLLNLFPIGILHTGKDYR